MCPTRSGFDSRPSHVAKIETFQWFSGKELKTQFGFRVVDDNGEIIASSEGYASKSSAKRGAENLLNTAARLRIAKDTTIEHVG